MTKAPLSYLTDSAYYIPGRTTEAPRGSGISHQLISGNPKFDDDDLASRYIPPEGFSDFKIRGGDRDNQNTVVEENNPNNAEGDYVDTLDENSSIEEQERYGLFFIGDKESFGGSEEHFEEIPYSSLYIPSELDEDDYFYSDRNESPAVSNDTYF